LLNFLWFDTIVISIIYNIYTADDFVENPLFFASTNIESFFIDEEIICFWLLKSIIPSSFFVTTISIITAVLDLSLSTWPQQL